MPPRLALPRFVVAFHANRCHWLTPGDEDRETPGAFVDPSAPDATRLFRCATVDDLYDVLHAFPMQMWAGYWERISPTCLRAWLARTTDDGRTRTRIGAIYMLAPMPVPAPARTAARPRVRRPLLVHGVDEISGWEA